MTNITQYVLGVERIVQAEALRLGLAAPVVRRGGRGDPTSSTGMPHTFSIDLPGWMTSLHQGVTDEWENAEDIAVDLYPWKDNAEQAQGLTAIAAYDAEMTARMLLFHLEPVFAEQIERRDVAALLGIAAPVEDLADVAHMRIDSWTRDAIMRIGHDTLKTVREMVSAFVNDPDGSPTSIEKDGRSVDIDVELVRMGSHVRPLALVGLPVCEGAVFDGYGLQLHNVQIPETAMSAIIGKRLGELVDKVPVLGSRVVTRAESWISSPGTATDATGRLVQIPRVPVLKLWLEPDPVPVEG